MGRNAVVPGIFLLVGAAFGFLIASAMDEKREEPPVARPPLPEPVQRPAPAVDESPPRASAPKPRPRSPEPAPAATAPANDLATLVRSVDVPRYGGKGRITGRVRTPEGEPLAGVLIRAGAEHPRLGRSRRTDRPPEAENLQAAIRAAVADHRRATESCREARTNEDGRFVLTDIGDGAYRVQAWAEGYEIRSHLGRMARAGRMIEFTARPVIWLTVSVLRPDGSVASRARVHCKYASMTSTRDWTPEGPDVWINANDVEVVVFFDRDGRMESARPANVPELREIQ